jgi:hypothetical protein
MFAAGLLIGAAGAYAVTRRSDIARLARDSFIRDEGEDTEVADVDHASPTSHRPNRSNHGRKAEVEVR